MVNKHYLTETQQRMRYLSYTLVWGTAMPVLFCVQYWHYTSGIILSSVAFPLIAATIFGLIYLAHHAIDVRFSEMANKNRNKDLYRIDLDNFNFEECYEYYKKSKKFNNLSNEYHKLSESVYYYIETYTDFDKNIHSMNMSEVRKVVEIMETVDSHV